MGEVFVWRRGEVPSRVIKLTGVEITALLKERCSIVAVDKKGSVVKLLEHEDNNPLTQKHSVRALSHGKNHTVGLTRSGRVYTWGQNDFGQLGLGHHDDVEVPSRIGGSLNGKKIRSADCGDFHTIVLTEDGDLYSFGSGERGQHGQPGRKHQLAPKLVGPFVQASVKVLSVSCGSNFTVCSTSRGEVWTWGNGSSGQLGHGSAAISWQPKKISNLCNIVGVAAGRGHAGAFDRDGKLYMWGLNSLGQLGLRDCVSRKTPCLVSSCGPVAQLSCGNFYTAAVTKDGSLYTWGSLSAPLGTAQDLKETKQIEGEEEVLDQQQQQDTKTTTSRYSRAPIFGASYRRVRKMPLVKQSIDRPRSRSVPLKVDALSGLRLTSVVCGETMMAAYATPSLERLSVSCGPFSGGTPMKLYGSAFWASENIQVRFSFENKEIFVSGTFNDGIVTCISPKLEFKTEESASVDVIFGPGSQTQQGLPFMYYGKVTSKAMEPCLGAARGGWIARISGTGFRDVESAVVRFRPDDNTNNAFYTSATYDSETDTFVCKVPNVSSEGFPGNVFVDVSLNGIDYEEVEEDTKNDDEEDEGEIQGQRRVKILMYDDEIVRCVPYAVHLKDEMTTNTTLRLRGRGFPRSTRDRSFEVTVKLKLNDQEHITRGVVEGSTKVSCALPKLTRQDVFGNDKQGSVLTQVSMTFDGINYSNSFPLYLYAGQLGEVEPNCGPTTGSQTVHLKSSWFFPSKNIKIRFRGSSKTVVADGTFHEGDIVCVVLQYPNAETVNLAVSMDGSNFMSKCENGSALKYTYFDVPTVCDVRFVECGATPSLIEDAAGEDMEMDVRGLVCSSDRIRLKVVRVFGDDDDDDDDNDKEKKIMIIDPVEIRKQQQDSAEDEDQEGSRHLISFVFPSDWEDEEEEVEKKKEEEKKSSTVRVTLYLEEFDYDVPGGDGCGVFRFDVDDDDDDDNYDEA